MTPPELFDETCASTRTTKYDAESLALLLESFPFNEAELERVLELQNDLTEGCLVVNPALAAAAACFVEILPNHFVGTFVDKAIESVFVLGAPPDQLEQWTYLEAVAACLGRRGPRPIHETIFAYAKGSCAASSTDKILSIIYRIIVASHWIKNNLVPESAPDLEVPAAWTLALNNKKELSRHEFMEWSTADLPFMYAATATLFHHVLFSNLPESCCRPEPFSLPQVDKDTLLWSNPTDPVPVTLACLSASLGGTWRRIHSNNDNSSSFRAFANAIIAYRGPTVILIKTTAGDVFGYYSDSIWKYSRAWYGQGSDCFLFSIQPRLKIFNPTGEGQHYQYLNLPPSHRKEELKGLAIGGIGHAYPRVHIKESLENCLATSVDTTFEKGSLLSDDMESYFDIDVIEVWATNQVSDSDFERFCRSGEFQASIIESTRRQAATVDRGQLLDDFVAGALLNKNFEHREHTTGRCEFRREESNI